LSWFEELVGHPVPGLGALDSVEAIHERRVLLADEALVPAEMPSGIVMTPDVLIRTRDRYDLTAEVARPRDAVSAPVLVYLHGGAWCAWSPREVRRATFRLAAAGFMVVTPAYGLAPEHPFPCAVEDVIYTLQWVRAAAAERGGDPARVGLAGDSAGANLAAAAAVALDGGGELAGAPDLIKAPARLRALLLCCGTYDFPARSQDGGGAPGVVELMGNLAYLGPHFLRHQRNPLVSPVYAESLAGLPATYLSCGARDQVLTQSLQLAARLAGDGVGTTLSVVEDADHEFLLHPDPPAPTAAEWVRIIEWLTRRFDA
jgi:acetyl esterase